MKEQVNNDEYYLYRSQLGDFLMTFAGVEEIVYDLMVKFSGVDPIIARAIFGAPASTSAWRPSNESTRLAASNWMKS